MAGKMLMFKVTGKCESLFRPHQMGVGTPKGAEAAVHAIRAFVTSHTSRNKVLLKIDFKNAFNQVRRDVILNQVKINTPEIYQFVYQSYSEKSNLYFGSHSKEGCVIDSQEGVQQGDPLGPFLFSLAIKDLISSCESELNCWYLDDGTIASNPETVMEDYKKILQCSDSLGLSVNPNKCEIYIIDPDSQECKNAWKNFCKFTEGIKLIQKHDLTLLGAPILPEAIEGVLNSKLESLKLMASRLEEIDKHDALFLLRQCFAIPKVTYFFRTGPCFMKPEILEEYDQVIKEALTNILNMSFINESVWNQCTLPVKEGGLGVRSAKDLALPAYLSSRTASFQTASSILPTVLRDENSLFFNKGCEEWMKKLGLTTLNEFPVTQRGWDMPLYKLKLQSLIDNAQNDTEKARILSISSEWASDWLNALPLSSLGLKLSDVELPLLCSLRLGATLCQPHPCICGKNVESDGRHGLNCGQWSVSEVNHLIKRALSQIDCPSILEPKNLLDNGGLIPDGVTAFPYKQGKCLTWDFTCVNTISDSYVLECAKEASKGAAAAEYKKDRKYESLLENYIFIPIAVESFGSWGQRGMKFIKEIGRKIREKTGDKNATRHIVQAISMSVQRGNATSIMGTLGTQRKLDDYFDIILPKQINH